MRPNMHPTRYDDHCAENARMTREAIEASRAGDTKALARNKKRLDARTKAFQIETRRLKAAGLPY